MPACLRLSSPTAESLLYWCGQLCHCPTLEEAAGCLQQACGSECRLVQVHREGRLVAHMGSQDGVQGRVQLEGRLPDGETFRIILGVTVPDPATEELKALGVAISWGVGRRDDELLEIFASLGARQTRERMLVSLSHELRTPLNAIIGFTDLLGQGKLGELNPKQARYVGHVATSGRQLLSLVNDLLDLAGPVRLEPAEVNLASLARSLEVPVDGPEEVPAWADPGRVVRILEHLVSNARRSGGEVRVRVGPDPRVTVADTGVGMDREELRRLLEPFEQGTSGYSREQTGVGLGLALVRRLVERQGGRLFIESEKGKGTEVTFTLPHERTAP